MENNHELYQYIAGKKIKGMMLNDAIELMLGMFCTLDVLPVNFRNEVVGRSELSTIFSQLAQNGFIYDSETIGNICMPEFWNSIIDDFMSGKLKVNLKIDVLEDNHSKGNANEE